MRCEDCRCRSWAFDVPEAEGAEVQIRFWLGDRNHTSCDVACANVRMLQNNAAKASLNVDVADSYVV